MRGGPRPAETQLCVAGVPPPLLRARPWATPLRHLACDAGPEEADGSVAPESCSPRASRKGAAPGPASSEARTEWPQVVLGAWLRASKGPSSANADRCRAFGGAVRPNLAKVWPMSVRQGPRFWRCGPDPGTNSDRVWPTLADLGRIRTNSDRVRPTLAELGQLARCVETLYPEAADVGRIRPKLGSRHTQIVTPERAQPITRLLLLLRLRRLGRRHWRRLLWRQGRNRLPYDAHRGV